MPLGANIAVRTTQRVIALLPRHLRRKTLGVAGLLFLNSLLELFGLATLVPVFAAILEDDATAVPWLRPVYELVGPMRESAFVALLAGFALLMFVAKSIGVLWIARALARFSFSVYEAFSVAAHRKLFAEGLQSMRSRDSHEITRDINVATRQFAQALVLPLLMFWNEFILLVIILLAVLAIEPMGALLLTVVLIPSSLLFYRSVRKRAASINQQMHAQSARLNRDLYESVYGYADVVLCGRQAFFRDLYERDVQVASDLSVRQYVLGVAPNRMNEIAAVIGVCSLVVYGVYHFEDRGELSFLLGIFALAAYRALPSMNRILGALLSVRGHEHLFDVIEAVQGTDEAAGTSSTAPLPFVDAIELRDLGFRYDGAEALTLRGVSLTVPRGTCLGVVGPSGSGKTTLMNVLLRFLIEDEGGVFVDGRPLLSADTAAWRALIGFVPQDVFLVDGSLKSNVAFGQVDVETGRLARVIRQASLDDVVASLPMGVDSPVGERGALLSGGQRQRIAIARALYAGAEILVFDEATSALDSQTEREITDSMRELLDQGLTIIVVAHRISTLRHCDQIVRLEAGRVVERTSYAEIQRRHGETESASR